MVTITICVDDSDAYVASTADNELISEAERTPARSVTQRPVGSMTWGCAVRGARCAVRGARCAVRGARCEVRGARCEVRGVGCEVRGAACGVRRREIGDNDHESDHNDLETEPIRVQH